MLLPLNVIRKSCPTFSAGLIEASNVSACVGVFARAGCGQHTEEQAERQKSPSARRGSHYLPSNTARAAAGLLQMMPSTPIARSRSSAWGSSTVQVFQLFSTRAQVSGHLRRYVFVIRMQRVVGEQAPHPAKHPPIARGKQASAANFGFWRRALLRLIGLNDESSTESSS